MKYFVCSEDPEYTPLGVPCPVEAVDFADAKAKMCNICKLVSPAENCAGPIEAPQPDLPMVTKKTWQEFRDTGLFWWINSILHTFGWAICVEFKDGIITNSFPARVKFRGFDEKNNTAGYIRVAEYIKQHADEILEEAKS